MAPGSTAAQTTRERIEEMLADDLDKAHVSEQHLALWLEDEGASFRKAAAARTEGERALAAWLTSQATSMVGGRASCMLKAMHVFDSLPQGTVAGVPVLEQASAVWVLCRKSEACRSHQRPTDGSVDLVVSIANSLVADARVRQLLTEKELAALQLTTRCAILGLERRILSAQDAGAWPPSIAEWLPAMSRRFDLATRQSCREALEASERWGERVAAQVLVRAAATGDCPPSQQAAGVLGLALALSGLLPRAFLRPRGAEGGSDWELALGALAAQPCSAPLLALCGEVPASLPPESVSAALEFAAMQTAGSIRLGAQAVLAACDPFGARPACSWPPALGQLMGDG